jgi:hypothetical protein
VRIQSSHDFTTRGLDAYWTCEEAIRGLIALEGDRVRIGFGSRQLVPGRSSYRYAMLGMTSLPVTSLIMVCCRVV